MTEQKPIVYLDLDRTVFQTSLVGRMYGTIGELFEHVDAKKAYAEIKQYFVHTDDGRYYHDFSAHLEALGLVPEDVYTLLLESDLANGQMEFPGVAELVAMLEDVAEVRILTYGAADYQICKAGLCPSLAGIPIITTTRHKAEVLAEFEEECWLIDDNPIGEELPNNVSFIQVDLERRGNTPVDAFWPVFDNLTDTKDYLYDQLH
ncbi:hypothetical protein B7Z17_02825 [Candidatus Saccharibacteria bacterium 32-49-10]|nr:MAG: hypothetical protein B7Z17_02825 [Candidatus Saccharibacteria bacterium 32-49-10]